MKRIISWLVTVVLIVGAIAWLSFSIAINRQVEIEAGTIFTVESGWGVYQISGNLEEQGLIRSAFFFNVHVKLSGKQTEFQAGDYLLEESYDIKELVIALTSGQALSKEKVILIKEGLTIKDIAQYLDENELLDGQAFRDLALTKIDNLPDEFDEYEWLNQAPSNATLEGYLFPDTYRIFEDATTKDLIIKMLDNFESKVDAKLLLQIVDQQKSLSDVITMASIIEKEVRPYKDMQIVSGIFWQRIGNYQPLQSCATLAYILGENKPQYTLEDTKIDSPYNTYQNYGLPPGPIANPGLQAIKAAIYPLDTNYNYFLSRSDTGETVFSATYAEHLANKNKYIQ